MISLETDSSIIFVFIIIIFKIGRFMIITVLVNCFAFFDHLSRHCFFLTRNYKFGRKRFFFLLVEGADQSIHRPAEHQRRDTRP